MSDEVKVKQKGTTAEITLVHRLEPGQKVISQTEGWGSNTYHAEVVAFVPKGKPLPQPVKGISPVSWFDRYLIKVQRARSVRYMAPLAGKLEAQNQK